MGFSNKILLVNNKNQQFLSRKTRQYLNRILRTSNRLKKLSHNQISNLSLKWLLSKKLIIIHKRFKQNPQFQD
jgi:hypothetical protein